MKTWSYAPMPALNGTLETFVILCGFLHFTLWLTLCSVDPKRYNCTRVLYFVLLVTEKRFFFALLQPMQLKFSDFDLFRLEEGEDTGKLCLSLKGLFTDKACKLSLDNPTLRREEGFHTAIENDRDPYTSVNLFLGIKRHYPTGWADTILHRATPSKVLKKRWKELGESAFLPCADLTQHSVFGGNYISANSSRILHIVVALSTPTSVLLMAVVQLESQTLYPVVLFPLGRSRNLLITSLQLWALHIKSGITRLKPSITKHNNTTQRSTM